MQRLENELDVPLFERTKSGMKLTKYGLYARTQMEQMQTIRNTMQDNLNSMKTGHQTVLRIGVSFGVISALPDHFLLDFENMHPEIQLHLQEYSDFKCEEAVLTGKEELGFNIAPIDNRLFKNHTVVRDHMCLLVNRSNPLSEKDIIRFDELKNEQFLLLTDEFKLRNTFVNHCRTAGFEPRILLETMELILIHNFSRLNKGIGVSVFFVANGIPDIKTIPFTDESCSWEVCMITDRNRKLSQAGQAFWDYVCSIPCFIPSNKLL
jgi:DNA-binding transcriptional LysR family regulator